MTTTTIKTAYIIGKHESVKGFANLIPCLNNTYGINHAALWYNTQFAFTGHEEIFKLFFEGGEYSPVPHDHIIVAQPFFEGTKAHLSQYAASIKQNSNEDVHKYVDLTDGELRYHMLNAFQKNINFYFPNYWTSLHLLIFYLIWHGFNEIHIMGCNLEVCDTLSNLTQEQCEYAKRHTTRMINIAHEMGINICWHESRTMYDYYLECKNHYSELRTSKEI